MQPHPIRQVWNRGVDRSCSYGPDWETHGRQPRVLVHHIGAGGIARGFKIFEAETNRHGKPVGQPRAYERFIALSAHSFNEEARDVVAEIVVLIGRANIEAEFEIPHGAEQFGVRAIAGDMPPVSPLPARLKK